MGSSLFINKTYSRKQLMGLLEAILFVNGKPVNYDLLSESLDMSKKDLQAMIDEMNEDFAASNRGITIIKVAGGFQLVSNPAYVEELSELFTKRNENQLSKSAMETLAVIAYKQPVTKEAVDEIRGVSSTRSINLLIGLKLVAISGSTDDIVKSPLYSTTSHFMEQFRIQSLDDLPDIDSLNLDDFESEDDEPSSGDEENPEELDTENEDDMDLNLSDEEEESGTT